MTTTVRCRHCGRPVLLIDRPFGQQWVHARGDLTGLCYPHAIGPAEDGTPTTTVAEPE